MQNTVLNTGCLYRFIPEVLVPFITPLLIIRTIFKYALVTHYTLSLMLIV